MFAGAVAKNSPGGNPRDPKPNLITNLTHTLPLTPNAGHFSWGIFSWHHSQDLQEIILFKRLIKKTLLHSLRYILSETTILFRSSRKRCSIKKLFLKSFAIFSGKHLCCSLFLIKFRHSDLQLYWKETTLLKSTTQVLSCEYCETFKGELRPM